MNRRHKKQKIGGKEGTRENIVILDLVASGIGGAADKMLSVRPAVIRSSWTTDEHSRGVLDDNKPDEPAKDFIP